MFIFRVVFLELSIMKGLRVSITKSGLTFVYAEVFTIMLNGQLSEEPQKVT